MIQKYCHVAILFVCILFYIKTSPCVYRFAHIKKKCPLCKQYFHSSEIVNNYQLENIIRIFQIQEPIYKSLLQQRKCIFFIDMI